MKNFAILFSTLCLLFNISYSQPSNITVDAGAYYFNPDPIEIEVGSTVTWINVGGLHDVNGVTNTLTKTENYLKKINKELDVIVECRNQKEIDSALNFNFVNRILLDNYNPSELSKAISSINGRKSTEASGRIGKNNIIEYAETGVDFISIGELTNNLKSIDMSLKAMVN